MTIINNQRTDSETADPHKEFLSERFQLSHILLFQFPATHAV